MNTFLLLLMSKARQNLALVMVAWLGFLIMGYLMLTLAPPIYLNEPDFDGVAIHAKIEQVVSYSRGDPRVLFSDKRNLLLKMPSADSQKYIQAKDSIIKEKYSGTITVYRKYPLYTEVSVFSENGTLGNQYSGLLQRYRIPHSTKAL